MKKYVEKSMLVSRVYNKQQDRNSRSETIQCNKSIELLNIIHTLHDMLYVIYTNISKEDVPSNILELYDKYIRLYIDLLGIPPKIEHKIFEGRKILLEIAICFPRQYLKLSGKGFFEAKDYIDTFRDVSEQGQNSFKETRKAKLYLMNRTEFSEKLDILKKKSKHRVLDTEYWHLGINAAFIQGGINIGSRFKIKTELLKRHDIDVIIKKYNSGADFLQEIQDDKDISPILYDHKVKCYNTKVLAREIAQLIDAGYVFWEVESKQGEYSLQALPDLSTAQKYYESKSFVTD